MTADIKETSITFLVMRMKRYNLMIKNMTDNKRNNAFKLGLTY